MPVDSWGNYGGLVQNGQPDGSSVKEQAGFTRLPICGPSVLPVASVSGLWPPVLHWHFPVLNLVQNRPDAVGCSAGPPKQVEPLDGLWESIGEMKCGGGEEI